MYCTLLTISATLIYELFSSPPSYITMKSGLNLVESIPRNHQPTNWWEGSRRNKRQWHQHVVQSCLLRCCFRIIYIENVVTFSWAVCPTHRSVDAIFKRAHWKSCMHKCSELWTSAEYVVCDKLSLSLCVCVCVCEGHIHPPPLIDQKKKIQSSLNPLVALPFQSIFILVLFLPLPPMSLSSSL